MINVRTFPELMEAYEKGGAKAGGERIADLASVMAMLALPAAIGLALVAEPLARTFLTPAYVETARTVIPLGALAGILVGLKMFVFDQALHMTKAIWRNILVTVPAMAFSLALTAWLAARFGAQGCILGVVAQAAFALAITVIQARRAVPLSLHGDDLARIGLMCAVMTVCTTLALALSGGWPAAVQLGAATLTGALSYAASGWLLMPRPLRELLPRRDAGSTAAIAS